MFTFEPPTCALPVIYLLFTAPPALSSITGVSKLATVVKCPRSAYDDMVHSSHNLLFKVEMEMADQSNLFMKN